MRLPKKIETLAPGKDHSDGDGLYLRISKDGSKRNWLFRARPYAGAAPKMYRIGTYPEMSARQARNRTNNIKDAMEGGVELERFIKLTAGLADLDGLTVEQACRREHQRMQEAKKPPTQAHLDRWIRILELHLFPALGPVPIADVSTAILAEAIRRLWVENHVTAQRVIKQFAVAWDLAQALGSISQQSRNITETLPGALPKMSYKAEHFDALPVADVPAFYGAVCALGNVADALAFRLLILTGTRSNEVRGARWGEVDLEADGGPVWTIPAERMKADREHKIALTPEAVEVLEAAAAIAGDSPLVFPSPRTGKELSTPTMLRVIDKADESAGRKFPCTVHGFRSSFRQWAAEAGEDDVQAELYLAHTIKVSAVEGAYKRGAKDMQAAREIAQRWAAFVAP